VNWVARREDKPEVAARVAWAGAGIDLRTASPTPEVIRDAVRRLLTDQEFRHNALRISDDYSRHDAPATAADLLEKFASGDRTGPDTSLDLPTTAPGSKKAVG
jgi:UDP:flavonoid glycosyltransferase YjiC (YdhE family)